MIVKVIQGQVIDKASKRHLVMCSSNGLDLVFAYLNDCVLAGTVSAVSEAFKELQLTAASLGISAHRQKLACAANITSNQFPSFGVLLSVRRELRIIRLPHG